MTVHLPSLLEQCYDVFHVVATESELVSSILQNPGKNEHNISRVIQKRRYALFWPPAEVEAKDLPFHGQVGRSRFKSISAKEARAWQNILPGRRELTPETRTLYILL